MTQNCADSGGGLHRATEPLRPINNGCATSTKDFSYCRIGSLRIGLQYRSGHHYDIIL